MKSRKIKKILIDHELITYEDKLIFAERAFIANSAAQWGMGKISRNEFSQKQIDNFGKILMMYFKGRIDLCWENGILRMEAVEEHAQG